MELRDYIRIVRRWLWLLLLGAALGAIAGYGLARMNPPSYRAKTTVVVRVDSQPNQPLDETILLADRLTTLYAELLRTRPLLEAVIGELQLGVSPESLARRVQVSVSPTTLFMTVTVEDGDPARAAEIANALIAAVSQQNQRLLGNRYEFIRSSLSVIEPATPPRGGLQAQLIQMSGLGLVAGMLLAAGVVVVVEFLDDRVRSLALAETLVKAPVLAALGPSRRSLRKPLADPAAAEGYALARAWLRLLAAEHQLQVILVASGMPGEGRSSVAANLAASLATGGQRVILADTDLRKPALHRAFGLPAVAARGVAGWLGGDPGPGIEQQLQPTGIPGLRLLPAGQPSSSTGSGQAGPADLLASPRLESLLAELRAHADVVVLDSPPALGVADLAALSRVADAALLVIDARKTRARALARTRARLAAFRLPVAGGILRNAAPEERDAQSAIPRARTVPKGAPGQSERNEEHASAPAPGD